MKVKIRPAEAVGQKEGLQRVSGQLYAAMDFRTCILALCFLCTGIIRHHDGVGAAGSTFSQSRRLFCSLETQEVILLSSEVKYNRQDAWLLLGREKSNGDVQRNDPENPPPDDAVLFIVKESSVDILQHADGDINKLKCMISPYFTDNIQILWPGVASRPAELNPWFTGTIKHVDNKFTMTVFFVQSSSTHKVEDGQKPGSHAKRLHASGVFLVRAGPSVVHSGLKKDVLFNCAFSVDHHADLTIKWVLLRKGGSKKVLFAYKVSTKKVEHQDKRVEVFLAEIPRGNASLLLRGVQVRDEGNYVCSVAASSLLGEQDIRLQVLEKPTVMLNADSLALVEGEEQKLVCSVKNFYPLDAQAQWFREPKKQGMLPDVINHVLFSSHRENSNGTYSYSSYFLLTASLRDDGLKYTCHVAHQSLTYPIKKSVMLRVTGAESVWPFGVLGVLTVLTVPACWYLYKVMTAGQPRPY
ncbi:PREDICTED: tapasin-related protein-like [Crocodylus porosus]|uniref:Tapasin-related protein-like n=1 Tax=Crocodylus porosus TaxID=8502 RepID=A0A7M4ENV6_CROPO|nr:PREDICTED: tapasin-related protein-like [Crocodylus porosus]